MIGLQSFTSATDEQARATLKIASYRPCHSPSPWGEGRCEGELNCSSGRKPALTSNSNGISRLIKPTQAFPRLIKGKNKNPFFLVAFGRLRTPLGEGPTLQRPAAPKPWRRRVACGHPPEGRCFSTVCQESAPLWGVWSPLEAFGRLRKAMEAPGGGALFFLSLCYLFNLCR
jgi:hypothetical protein